MIPWIEELLCLRAWSKLRLHSQWKQSIRFSRAFCVVAWPAGPTCFYHLMICGPEVWQEYNRPLNTFLVIVSLRSLTSYLRQHIFLQWVVGVSTSMKVRTGAVSLVDLWGWETLRRFLPYSYASHGKSSSGICPAKTPSHSTYCRFLSNSFHLSPNSRSILACAATEFWIWVGFYNCNLVNGGTRNVDVGNQKTDASCGIGPQFVLKC